jgi:hypothetical protein
MMLNINLDYNWIMGEGANYKTSIILTVMGENKFVIAIWAGVSSNDALSSPARTKRLLRRLLFPMRALVNPPFCGDKIFY